MTEIPVEYGNMEGQYFTQWRIDLLNEFLQTIVYAYGETPLVAVEDVKIWYDRQNCCDTRADRHGRSERFFAGWS